MRALTVRPGVPGSLEVTDVPDPGVGDGRLLVDGLAIGVCGTDREIVAGEFGTAPPGEERLIIGHESLGRVRKAPAGSAFAPGDLVASIVRRPDPEPCGACARGEFDMCRNGRYTERGIKQLPGFASEAWAVEPEYAVRLDAGLEDVGVLLEPASVLAKAWEQVDRIGGRAWFSPRRVLVTGAGPIGLLGALLGVLRGLDVHVLDRATTGSKPALVHDLGGTYHHDLDEALAVGPDVVIEATAAPPVIQAVLRATASYGIVCLTGVAGASEPGRADIGAINDHVVLGNRVVVGSVNANRYHWQTAAEVLCEADTAWLGRLVTRRVPLAEAGSAFEPRGHDVKVVVDLTG